MGKSRDGRGGAQYRVVANCSGSTVHVRESPSFPSRALEGIFVDREERVRVSELQLTNVMGADVVFMKLVDLPGWICDRMPVTGTLMFEEITPDQLDAEYAHNRQWQSPPRSTRPVPRWQEQQQQRYPAAQPVQRVLNASFARGMSTPDRQPRTNVPWESPAGMQAAGEGLAERLRRRQEAALRQVRDAQVQQAATRQAQPRGAGFRTQTLNVAPSGAFRRTDPVEPTKTPHIRRIGVSGAASSPRVRIRGGAGTLQIVKPSTLAPSVAQQAVTAAEAETRRARDRLARAAESVRRFARSITRRGDKQGSRHDEFQMMYNMMFPPTASVELMTRATFERTLLNYNSACHSDVELSSETLDVLFNTLDVDGNKKLSRRELLCGLIPLFDIDPVAGASAMFDACDQRDGASSTGDGLLQYDEFTVAFRSIFAIAPLLYPKKFQNIDSVDELGKVHAKQMFDVILKGGADAAVAYGSGIGKADFVDWFVSLWQHRKGTAADATSKRQAAIAAAQQAARDRLASAAESVRNFARSITRRGDKQGSRHDEFQMMCDMMFPATAAGGAKLMTRATFERALSNYKSACHSDVELSSETLDVLFNTLDVDGNKKLSRRELLCGLIPLFDIDPVAGASAMFDACDQRDGASSTGDGLLQYDEFTVAFRSIFAIAPLLYPKKFQNIDSVDELGKAQVKIMFDGLLEGGADAAVAEGNGIGKADFVDWFVGLWEHRKGTAANARSLTKVRERKKREFDAAEADAQAKREREAAATRADAMEAERARRKKARAKQEADAAADTARQESTKVTTRWVRNISQGQVSVSSGPLMQSASGTVLDAGAVVAVEKKGSVEKGGVRFLQLADGTGWVAGSVGTVLLFAPVDAITTVTSGLLPKVRDLTAELQREDMRIVRLQRSVNGLVSLAQSGVVPTFWTNTSISEVLPADTFGFPVTRSDSLAPVKIGETVQVVEQKLETSSFDFEVKYLRLLTGGWVSDVFPINGKAMMKLHDTKSERVKPTTAEHTGRALANERRENAPHFRSREIPNLNKVRTTLAWTNAHRKPTTSAWANGGRADIHIRSARGLHSKSGEEIFIKVGYRNAVDADEWEFEGVAKDGGVLVWETKPKMHDGGALVWHGCSLQVKIPAGASPAVRLEARGSHRGGRLLGSVEFHYTGTPTVCLASAARSEDGSASPSAQRNEVDYGPTFFENEWPLSLIRHGKERPAGAAPFGHVSASVAFMPRKKKKKERQSKV